MFGQPICKQCGQPIVGNYVTALGATWHREHFVCAACGNPITETSFVTHQNAPYHTTCYEREIVPHCVFCARPLVGEYLVNYWGQQYCKEHEAQYPHCSFCGRLVPPAEREARAERVRCSVCRSNAIETADEGRPIFRELIQWISAQGLRYNSLPIRLELWESAKLAEHLKLQGHGDPQGATLTTTYMEDNRVVRTEVNIVAVLRGLPTMLFRGVTIHELGHVWLAVHGIQHLPPWAEEGFCEVLAHRYYQGLNTPEGRFYRERIEKNKDQTYGDGFRHVQQIVERLGFERFLQTLQTTKQLPR